MTLFYGWIVVAVGILVTCVGFGGMLSLGVFLPPISEAMRADGRVLSRDQLLETVWGYANAAEVESRTVDVHVRRLRAKLGAEARRIVTVKAVGYRFDGEA